MAETVGGSCLCGGVRFEVTLPFTRAIHCHCSRCRKHSGAFGLTVGHIPREQFQLLEGEELIRVYDPAARRALQRRGSLGLGLEPLRRPAAKRRRERAIRLGAGRGDPARRRRAALRSSALDSKGAVTTRPAPTRLAAVTAADAPNV